MTTQMDDTTKPTTGFSPFLLALKQELKEDGMKALKRGVIGDLEFNLRQGRDSVWAILRRPRRGGLAIRVAYAPGGITAVRALRCKRGEIARLQIDSAIGRHVAAIRDHGIGFDRLQITVQLTPSAPLVVPFVPRDLYPLDDRDNPTGAIGAVEAAQRGMNSGLLYLRLAEPGFGTVLYFQNLTSLNDYYLATDTKPDGAVGGEWPELGYLLPSPPQSGTPSTNPLPAGKPITISDMILVMSEKLATNERESARFFVQMLGAAYGALDQPDAEYRDWVARADRTLEDLERSPKATITHYGHRYAHPYTASEYPDSMVQLSLLAAMRDYGGWRGEPAKLDADFIAGLEKFYDPELKTLRRYLPNVGKDKDADAVDSWYLYHPLLNLGRLALAGDERARSLFDRSIDFAIKAAQHFRYAWPIQYNVKDFSIITATAADDRGQTDVGGIYAWVMLQAYELSRDERFLNEARAAIDAAEGMRFNLNYQANLTAWGAAACSRLWRITNIDGYREQSYAYLASFFHNAAIWESQLAHAAAYPNFFGVTCLQDAPYMAIYECFDSFAAFEYYLTDSGPELEPAARTLVSEYCKYTLSRAWFYYPDALPKAALATENRNGHIDANLSFPLEDLYVDGQQAGQVGQEIYGAGAAMIFATRAFRQIEGAPFHLWCDHFIMAWERIGEHVLGFRLDGGDSCLARLALVKSGRGKLPKVHVETVGGEVLRPQRRSAQRIEYRLPAAGQILLRWEA